MATYKYAFILNKKLQPDEALRTATHLALGLMSGATSEQQENMKFVNFVDADGGNHPHICALPIMLMRGTNLELRKGHAQAREMNVLCVDYIHSMLGNNVEDQLALTKTISAGEINYYGLGIFGDAQQVNQLVRRFTEWKW